MLYSVDLLNFPSNSILWRTEWHWPYLETLDGCQLFSERIAWKLTSKSGSHSLIPNIQPNCKDMRQASRKPTAGTTRMFPTSMVHDFLICTRLSNFLDKTNFRNAQCRGQGECFHSHYTSCALFLNVHVTEALSGDDETSHCTLNQKLCKKYGKELCW